MKNVRSQRGVTGIEVLAAIAVILAAVTVALVIAYFVTSYKNSQKSLCLTRLDTVRGVVTDWAKTTSPTNPTGDRQLCTTAKDMVEKYNKECGELIGKLPIPTCE